MNLTPSKHNIISPLTEGHEYIIVNVFSGNADIISQDDMKLLQQPQKHSYPQEFIDKGYVSDSAREEMDFKLRYIEFLEERESEEIQVFFVPTYACNFTCSYCYQSEYPPQSKYFHQS
jgi:uncharacterized protein